MVTPRKRIGVAVEGPSDKTFFNSLAGWFRARGLDPFIIQCNGRARMIGDCQRHYDSMSASGCAHIVFLLDQDQDECPPVTARRLRAVRGRASAVIAVMAKELEAWLLADDVALAQVTKQRLREASLTDTIDDPKGRLKDYFLRGGHRYPTQTEMVRAFGRHFSLDRAAGRNRSAKRFLEKIKMLAASVA